MVNSFGYNPILSKYEQFISYGSSFEGHFIWYTSLSNEHFHITLYIMETFMKDGENVHSSQTLKKKSYTF